MSHALGLEGGQAGGAWGGILEVMGGGWVFALQGHPRVCAALGQNLEKETQEGSAI